MEGEIWCCGSIFHHNLCLCGIRMKMSLHKKRFFFRETPTSPWVPFRVKFRPLGHYFALVAPLAYSLNSAGWSESLLFAWNKVRFSCNEARIHVIQIWYKTYNRIYECNIVVIFIYLSGNMFGLLKRTVSLRWFFWAPTTYVLVEN